MPGLVTATAYMEKQIEALQKEAGHVRGHELSAEVRHDCYGRSA